MILLFRPRWSVSSGPHCRVTVWQLFPIFCFVPVPWRDGFAHRVHMLVELKQGECIYPLSRTVHRNFVNDGNRLKGGGRAPTTLTSQGWFFHHDGMYARNWQSPFCVYSEDLQCFCSRFVLQNRCWFQICWKTSQNDDLTKVIGRKLLHTVINIKKRQRLLNQRQILFLIPMFNFAENVFSPHYSHFLQILKPEAHKTAQKMCFFVWGISAPSYHPPPTFFGK